MKTPSWIVVAGARPNFMKVAPLLRAIDGHNRSAGSRPVRPLLVHTGQHYDRSLSAVFFEELGIPRPDINLGVGSGSQAEQMGRIMIAFEHVALEERPALIIVVGDVNSTAACALVGAKLAIPVAHVEAGLRSFDRSMPEEINRIVTDQVSDYLFTPSADADENLLREGIAAERCFRVGNIMVDSLLHMLPQIRSEAAARLPEQAHCAGNGGYALLTLHRPSNVDVPEVLARELDCMAALSEQLPILFPVHPRTEKQIRAFGLEDRLIWPGNGAADRSRTPRSRLYALPPVGYRDCIGLMAGARLVLTDSGGVQEESTVLGIPCLTLRENTERPVTVSEGTNVLVGTDPLRIRTCFEHILCSARTGARIPALWDGRTGERIVSILGRKAA